MNKQPDNADDARVSSDTQANENLGVHPTNNTSSSTTGQIQPDLELSKKKATPFPNNTDNRPFKEPQVSQGNPAQDYASFMSSKIQSQTPMTQPRANYSNSSHELTPRMEKELLGYNHLTYLLYMVSFFTAGLTWIVPIVMNYLRRRDAQYSWLASHFDWQIKTFWYSIIVGFIGIVLMVVGGGGSLASLVSLSVSNSGGAAFGGSIAIMVLGGFVLLGAYLWHLYRLIKGWIALVDKRPVS